MSGLATEGGDRSLADAVSHAVGRCRDALYGLQRQAFDELAGRLGLGDDGGAGYFLDPRAFPVVQLPAWCLRRVADRGVELPDGTLDDLQEAAVAGYLHVRIQDDLLDEGLGDPVTSMLLAEALLLRHLVLLSRVAGPEPSFATLVEERWLRYGEAMLLEAQVHAGRTPLDEETFGRILDRSRPLVLPGAAALAAGGASADLATLDAYVEALVEGHQRFHDLGDAGRDLAEGRRTPVTERYGGDGDAASLRRGLVLEGGFDEVVDRARVALERAGALAEQIGLAPAAADARRRIAEMEEARRALFQGLFTAILEK